MRSKIRNFILFVALFVCSFNVTSQTISPTDRALIIKGLYSFSSDSLKGFDEPSYKQQALQNGFFGTEYNVFMYNAKKNYIATKYNSNPSVPTNYPTIPGSNAKPGGPGGPTINAAPCVNEDFEAGTFAGWTVSQGQNINVGGSCTMAGCCPNISTNTWIRTTPYAGPAPLGVIPASPLGGTQIAQLNDMVWNAGEIVRIQQTFPVAATNALFQFAYMAAMDGSGHACCDQPFMKITVLNCANQPLACPSVSITPPGASCVSSVPSGWTTNTSGVSYTTAWQIKSLDLTPYIGSCVTIQVTVGDCTGWAHAGMAYFDAVCKPMNVIVNNVSFPAGSPIVYATGCGASSATITAPPGLGPYSWTGPGGSGINNNPNQTITTTVTGNYTLVMSPVGACAPITKTVNLTFGANPTAGYTTVNSCNNYTFTNTGSAAPSVQTYSFIGAGAPPSFTTTNPTSSVAFNTPGTYTVQQVVTNTINCTATASTVINVVAGPTITVNSPSICPGAVANLTASGATTYTWTGPSLSNPNISNPTATPVVTSIYTVQGTSAGCIGTKTLQVTINPTPTLAVNSPSFCAGSSTALLANGATSYVWTPATGLSNPNIANPNANPATTTTYTIIGTGANTCTSSITSTVTVNPLPVLAMTSATTCAGVPASISASGANTYTWSTTATTSTITQSPVVNTNYTVTGSSVAGCTSTAVASITIKPNLVVNLGSNGPICTGNTLNLTSNVGSIWSWSGPNSFTSNVQNPSIGSIPVAGSGIYTVNVIDAFGCTGSGSINVVINPLPNPNIVTNSPICANQSLNLTGSGGNVYSWSGPGLSSNAQNPTIISASTANSGTYTLTVTDANGCINSTTANVTINPLPIVAVSGSSICSGATVNLNANGGTTYSWTGPLGYTSPLQNPTITGASSNMSGNYTVTVTNANGCVNTGIAIVSVSAPFTVAINNNGPICQGYTLNLSAPNGLAYQWSGPNGFFSNQTNPSIDNAQVLASGTYSVLATDANGCTGNAITNVIVNPNPGVSIISTAGKMCAPGCITFTCTSTNSVSSVNWYFSNGSPSSNMISTQCFSKGGIYTSTSTVTDINGCQGTATYSVEVYSSPVADFVYNPLRPIENEEIKFTDASFGANITNWYWFFNSQNVNSILQNPNAIYEPGTYPVTLIVKSDKGCTDTLTKIIVVGEDYGIYVPNAFTPNGDGLNDIFQPKGFGIVKYELRIFDRWGEEIFVSNEFAKGWDGTIKGKMCKDDVYVWKINLVNVFSKSHELTGHVTLIK